MSDNFSPNDPPQSPNGTLQPGSTEKSGHAPPNYRLTAIITLFVGLGILAIRLTMGSGISGRQALVQSVGKAVMSLVPPPDRVDYGGADDLKPLLAALKADRRIQSSEAYHLGTNRPEGAYEVRLTIDISSDDCSAPTADACARLIDDVARIALSTYEPIDQMAGITIAIDGQIWQSQSIDEWRQELGVP